MVEYEKQLIRLMKMFDDNGYSEHLILIGSWAEYMYMATGLLPDYEAIIRTVDIDFLVKNLRKPNPAVNIAMLAREEGYYVEEDRLTGVTKLLSKDGLEIEFLIAQKGKGDIQALKTNLGVTAQALRHLEILRANTVKVKHFDITINLPVPEAFVLHKMIINGERKQKIEKDQMVINKMYKCLDMNKFNTLFETLTKKEKKIVKAYIDTIITPLLEKEKKIEKAKEKLVNS